MRDAQMTPAPAHEPLAIIGMGCHFPGGATSPDAFWALLCAGIDATRDVPDDRWDTRKFYDPDTRKTGKMNTFHGGYLERLDQFDAQFFGIAPREAMWLDPQQRLLLQVAWEALEDAGQVADQLAGSNTGVFIGGFTLDYQLMQNFGVFSRYELQTHSATGMMMTMLANRISYVFGFHGPSMAVDTACSGSLVAVHLACQSIWNGECSMAIAGGANAMIAPTMTIAESKGGFLSPDGRSKAFDASANGYARGEGAGVVIIKPLAQALADGDPIHALVRGTAVTQDGHTNGITVPNGNAQERVMRLAYERAGVLPRDIQYVEAHGTGTPVGDPIEARAIGTVLSDGRPACDQCVVGSVKTNIGHLEAAAGIAGLIKTVLSLKHRTIPPHLHFTTPNPDIPFQRLQLRVPTEVEPWPFTAGPALAGVNSFGFGGTNAHVVLQEAPPAPAATLADTARPYLLPVSARSDDALRALAAAYRDLLSRPGADLASVAYSAALRRTHHDHRLALVAATPAEAVAQLDAFLAGSARAGLASGRVPPGERPRLVFVCSGMGPQWWAMGRELLETEPVFRAEIVRCDAALLPYTGWSLLDVLTADEDAALMDETEYAQPANFALQVALAALWKSWGIAPDALIGHSAGELAAHYLAGALSFEEAVRGIYHRSRLQQRTTGQGRMLAVGMTPETLHQAIDDAGGGVSIAAINSPGAVTLVGEVPVLEAMAQQLATFNVFHRFLNGKVPYHSHYMDDIREELLSSLADMQPQQARLPLYSTVTGTRIDGRGVDARYWWQNVRATVLFASAMGQMIQDGYSVFVELSPHPVLAGSIKELLGQQDQSGVVVASLRRKEPEQPTMLAALAALYTQGAPLAWQAFFPNGGTFTRLPAYPWQYKSYWTESVESREDRLGTAPHPLLGQRMSAAHPTWELELNPRLLSYLPDHRIQGNVLLPGTAYIELALAAAREVFGDGAYALEDVTFRKALFVPEQADPRLQTVINPQHATVEIYSYTPTSDSRWMLHATATIRSAGAVAPAPDVDALSQGFTTETTRDAFYRQSLEQGFEYGPMFQAIDLIEGGAGCAIGHLHAPDGLLDDLSQYLFHPALLDAAVQVLLAAARPIAPADEPSPGLYLPVKVARVRVFGQATATMRACARIRQASARLLVGDIHVIGAAGELLAVLEGFEAQSLEASISIAPDRIDRGLYELHWQAQERSADGPGKDSADGRWLILMDQTGVGAALLHTLDEQGQPYIALSHADTPRLLHHEQFYTLNPLDPQQFQQMCASLADANISRVIHLWSLDSAPVPTTATLEDALTIGSRSTVALMQALAQSGWTRLPHLWLVTRRAQAIGTPAGDVAIAQSPLWGLGRVIGHQEFASMWGGLIDLDSGPSDIQAGLLLDELRHATEEDQVAFRDGTRYVARLLPSARLTPPLPPRFRPDGSYLITGGLGALGLLVARWMVSHGARRLILMGRSTITARAGWHELAPDHPQYGLVSAIRELEGQGATIHLASADVADADQLAGVLAAYRRDGWPPIRGVIHTAGVVQDELLLRMSPETFTRVLRPKLHGGWNLHTLLADEPLDFFVLFGSTGSLITSLGQGNYAAGNAFLDALAAYRQTQGLPALTIGWGPWSVGMVEQLRLESFYARRGIDLITPEVGMQVLGRVLGQQPAQLTAITVDWATARAAAPQGALAPMYHLLSEQADDVADAPSDQSGILEQVQAAPATERQALLATHLHDLVARVLQLDPAQFSGHESLTALGIDSMMAIEVKHRIAATLRVDVSVLELLQGTSVQQLAGRLLTALAPAAEPEPTPIVVPTLDDIQQAISGADTAELERLLAELEQAAGNGMMQEVHQ